jgi:hypothetical protein
MLNNWIATCEGDQQTLQVLIHWHETHCSEEVNKFGIFLVTIGPHMHVSKLDILRIDWYTQRFCSYNFFLLEIKVVLWGYFYKV